MQSKLNLTCHCLKEEIEKRSVGKEEIEKRSVGKEEIEKRSVSKEEIEKKSVGETSKHNLSVQIKPAKKEDCILNNKLTFCLNKLSNLSMCNVNKIFKIQKANVQF